MSDGTREIRTDYLARVEGEGAMLVRVRDGALEEVQFKIFEPPRFFEALCGAGTSRRRPTSPRASAASARSRTWRALPPRWSRSAGSSCPRSCGLLRRLIYCGEWIESHVLHVAMLHAPDFLGYDGAIELARDRRDLVEIALRLKKLGNELMRVDRRPRGAPGQLPRRRLLPRADRRRAARARARARVGARRGARADALDGRVRLPGLRARLRVRLAAQPRGVPDRARPDRLQHGARHLGRRVRGALHARRHVERSNALHSTLEGVGAYLVGPLARYALNYEELSDVAQGGGGGGRPRARLPQPVPLDRRPRGRDGVRGRRGAADHRRVRAAGRPRGRRASRAPARGTDAPRRRAGSAGTATGSTTRGRSSTRRSCPPPPRTRRRSRRTWSAS